MPPSISYCAKQIFPLLPLCTGRNFKYLSKEAFVSLYKTLVRSHLEYAILSGTHIEWD